MLPFNSLKEAFQLYIDSTPDLQLKTSEELFRAKCDFYAGAAALSQLIIVGDQAHNLDEVFNAVQAEIMQHSAEAMLEYTQQKGDVHFDA